jgi:hypothetical protein
MQLHSDINSHIFERTLENVGDFFIQVLLEKKQSFRMHIFQVNKK